MYTFLKPEITPLYIIPIVANYSASMFNRYYITAKGAILSGITKNIIVSLDILFFFALFYGFMVALFKKYKIFISNFQVMKEIILSAFFFIWIITLLYQNFSLEYFDFRILIIFYILLYYLEYIFIKNIYEKQS